VTEQGGRIRRDGSRLVPMKAAQVVAEALKERILAGEYVPGDALPSADDLLAEFGVSRPTLREALNLLEGGGFVRLRRGPGGGASVRAPDNGEVVRALDALFRFGRTTPAHLMEVRVVLEPTAARLAALRATDDEVAQLRAILDRQSDADVLGDNGVWLESNLELHSQIARMSRNPVVRVLTESLRDLILSAAHGARFTVEDRAASVQQHRAIVDRIARRDAAGAERAHRDHLLDSIYVRNGIVEPAEWGERRCPSSVPGHRRSPASAWSRWASSSPGPSAATSSPTTGPT